MGISDEEFRAALSTARPYVIAHLVAGPNADDPDREAIVFAHAKRNVELHQAGVMSIVGPVVTDNRIRGVCIFSCDSDEARRVLDGDPSIEAGIFTYELLEVFTFPGSTLPE